MSLEESYNQLKKEYETYQKLAEETMQKQSMKIIELDKKLDMVSLIVEISEYINRCLGSSEIDYLINDIMIGILGVKYSSVYLMENRMLKLKASNLSSTSHHYIIDEFNKGKISKLDNSILNSHFNMCKDDSAQIHSSVYTPIYMKDKILGIIVVEHDIYRYLSEGHVKLLIEIT
ncbi:GAF domain-containing protein, partial [Clostridiaceae bacterium UIB06]|nr:GAF domain-containing protein [Clostridiaceae bacterium UIB06]